MIRLSVESCSSEAVWSKSVSLFARARSVIASHRVSEGSPPPPWQIKSSSRHPRAEGAGTPFLEVSGGVEGNRDLNVRHVILICSANIDLKPPCDGEEDTAPITGSNLLR